MSTQPELDEYFRQLKSGKLYEREVAAKELGRLGDVRAVKPLLEALGDDNATIIEALGNLGDSSAVEPLIAALARGRSSSAAAARALAQLGDLRAIEPLVAALRKGVIAAGGALAKLGGAQAVGPLIEALGDGHWEVRKAAVEALALLGEPQWSEWIKGDGKDHIRLCSSRDSRVVAVLVIALESKQGAEVIKVIVQTLGQSGNKAVVEPLLRSLEGFHYDFYWEVREATAQALGLLGDDRGIQPLRKLLKDPASSVRAAAAMALGRLGDACAFEEMIQLLRDDKEIVRNAAVAALGKLGDPRAIEPLVKVMDDYSVDLGDAAIEALVQLGNFNVVDPLVKAVLNGSSHAAEALGLLKDARAVVPLIQALGDRKERVRCSAAEALGELGDARAIEPLIQVIGDGAKEVRLAAAEALSQLGESQWSQWIKGDKEDFTRLGASSDPRAVPLLITVISQNSEFRWEARRGAATALLEILSSHPSLKLPNAQALFQSIRQPHEDQHSDAPATHDCHSDRHADRGIGGEIPTGLREADF